MLKGSKYYLISKYFKHFFINLLIFIFLIWISQILRIMEMKLSIGNQIIDVVKVTFYSLPSFISSLAPFYFINKWNFFKQQSKK
jgi:lipopolysaccharide export LptBFGC system permease protein LptF